jgi:hypothetical protein
MARIAQQGYATDRPVRQRLPAKHRPSVWDVDGIDDGQYVLVPAREVAAALRHRAGLRPAFDQPVVAFDRGDEIQKFAATQRVGDDMAVRADPGHAILLAEPPGQPFHRHHTAPGHEPGERGTRPAEQHFPDLRMHPVGADQRIAPYTRAAFQVQGHTGCVLLEADAACPDMHRAGRTLGERRDQRAMQIAAMQQPVR